MATLLTNYNSFSDRFQEFTQRIYLKVPRAVRTIRFKLAFIYSVILFFLASGLVLSFNVYLNENLGRDPERHIVRINPFAISPKQLLDDFASLRVEEKQRIRDIRLNDLRKVQLMSLYSLLPLAVVSFGIGYYVSGQFLSPISRLKANIEKLQTKDLGVAISSDDDDEVGALIASFNDLSSRLQEAFHSQEQFVQNASHELRTPLTIIQTNLDTALDDPQISQEQLKTAVSQALVGVNQLKQLVNYLLQLTSLPQQNMQQINLTELVRSQITSMKDLAKAQGITIKFAHPAHLVTAIKGDRALLERVIVNLLENAIKYSVRNDNSQATVKVLLRVKQNNVYLHVSNPSEEIPSEKLVKIFDRFYQVNPSRNKKIGGYGLGLSIVKKIIEEHNGTIQASYQLGIITFIVSFPR